MHRSRIEPFRRRQIQPTSRMNLEQEDLKKIFGILQACAPVPSFSAGGGGITPRGPFTLNSVSECNQCNRVDLGWVEAQQSRRGPFHRCIPP